jgi:hypothetical protein
VLALESIQLTSLYSEMSSAVISIRVGGRRSAILSFTTKQGSALRDKTFAAAAAAVKMSKLLHTEKILLV